MYRLAAFLLLVSLAPAVLADGAALYRWTDAQGVIHYSDRPPLEAASDLTAMDMPVLPAQDPAKIAEHQAELVAQAQAAQKLLQAALDQQAQATALAQQRAELAALQAEQAAQAQAAETVPAEPIYVSSAFVPRIYRANLYLPPSHRLDMPHHLPRPLRDRPISLLSKP